MPVHKKGDVVKNRTSGYYWMVMYDTRGYYVNVKPVPKEWGLKTGSGPRETTSDSIVRVTEERIKELKEKAAMSKVPQLFEFEHEGNKLYGTHMATNSEGLWVMDVKGSQPVAVPKDACVEVIPHSILIRSLSEYTKTHVMCDKNKVKKGETYITEQGMWLVLEVDTKTKCSGEFKPISRLLTEPVK